VQGGREHADAVAQARAALLAPETLPSARVLAAIRREHSDSFVGFVRAQSLQTHQHVLGLPWSAKQQARYEAMAEKSVQDQRAIEAADTMPFEIYRQEYISPARLGRPQVAVPA
jgi:glutamate--cysteine ligase